MSNSTGLGGPGEAPAIHAAENGKKSMTEQIIHTNGVDLCFETFGKSTDPAILLIAGGACSMLFWEEAFCERLAAEGPRFVVRYDLRDTGRSTTYEPGASPYTLQDLSDDAVGLLDALKVTKAHLVGFSLGGGIGQRIALEYPDRVASLTLISSSPIGAFVGEPDLPTMSPENMTKFTNIVPSSWSDREAVVRFMVEQERLGGSSLHPFDKERATARAYRVFDRAVNVQSMMNHGQVAFNRWERERLGAIRTPVLVIHGTEDPLLPYSHGVAMEKEIPNARLFTLEETGYELPLRVWDVAVAEILKHSSGC
jgi:pimeloyl-ACP methyl ester carboxylesterase